MWGKNNTTWNTRKPFSKDHKTIQNPQKKWRKKFFLRSAPPPRPATATSCSGCPARRGDLERLRWLSSRKRACRALVWKRVTFLVVNLVN
jgi:hypothetical protein